MSYLNQTVTLLGALTIRPSILGLLVRLKPNQIASRRHVFKLALAPKAFAQDQLSKMPPKKRAVEATTDSDGSVEANLSVKKSKSIKKVAVPVVPLDSSLPVNLLLEVPEGGFNKPREGEVRISAWNVCGIRASLKKGFK